MDRNNLKLLDGVRWSFNATVTKFDKTMGYAGPQRIICLSNVRLDPDRVASICDDYPLMENVKGQLFDELWLNCGQWSSILKVNDQITFQARVTLNKKHKLQRITKVVLLGKDEGETKDSYERESDLIKQATAYGKKLWEETSGTNNIILKIQELNQLTESKGWRDEYTESFRKLACKLVFEEWNSKSDDLVSRMHEFIVWFKVIIDPGIADINSRSKKLFFQLCMEQWFYFYQGE